MERCYGSFQMLNYIIPIVMFCVHSDVICNGQTKFFEEVLDPVRTPSQCLSEGTIHAAQYLTKWKEEHQNKEVDFRIVCKRSDEKT